MKKNILLIILGFILLSVIGGCHVSPTQGCIVIVNKSGSTVSHIKVGNTMIAMQMLPGSKFDYWFWTTISGKLTGLGQDEIGTKNKDKSDGIFTLVTNAWYECEVYEDDDTVYLDLTQYRQGKDYNNNHVHDDFYSD